jgi:hypothetical protein
MAGRGQFLGGIQLPSAPFEPASFEQGAHLKLEQIDHK